MNEKLITRNEAADLLGVSVRTVDRLIKGGHLTSVKLGTRQQSSVRVREGEVMAIVAGRTDLSESGTTQSDEEPYRPVSW